MTRRIRPPASRPQWRKMRRRSSTPGEGASTSAAVGRPVLGRIVSAMSGYPESRVEEGVQQICSQGQEDVDHGQDQHDRLHYREILALDGLPGEIAEAVDLEDRLDHDGAAQHE